MLRTEGAQQHIDRTIDLCTGLSELASLREQPCHREAGGREIGVIGSERALLRGERGFEQLLRAVSLAEIELHSSLVAHGRRDTGMVVTQRRAQIRNRSRVLVGRRAILRRTPMRESPVRSNRDGVDALFPSRGLA
jgi:hypothetical protein